MSIQELGRRLMSPLRGGGGEACVSLLGEQVAWLEEQCALLVRSEQARAAFTTLSKGDTHGVASSIASVCERTWTIAVDQAQTQTQAGEETLKIQEESEEDARVLSSRKTVLLARLLRNAVADNAQGQQLCFSVVPAALSTLWRTTSFALEQNKDMQLLSRTLVQMLANLVTANEALQAQLWDVHLDMNGRLHTNINGRPPSDLLCRLLASPEVGTQTASQVLVINLTLSSGARSASMAQTAAGAEIMRALLHTIHTHLEADEDEEEVEEELVRKRGEQSGTVPSDNDADIARRRRYEGLGILYAIFANLFARGHFDDALNSLRSVTPDDSPIDASLVSAAQVTLLKLLDSHLHFGKQSDDTQEVNGVAHEEPKDDLAELPSVFVKLATWADEAMNAVLKQANDTAPVDSRLVEVHVGLILVLQCLTTLAIATEKDNAEPAHARLAITGERLLTEMRTDAFITTLISLMRSTHAFSPAVSPFVAAAAAEQGKRARTTAPLPDGHVLSSTGEATLAAQSGTNGTPRPRLDKLKRDQVGLLGVLAYRRGAHDTVIVQRVQNVVRERGGLLDVLNLTQLDERNPYIRERAIFALRNLLQGNTASQDLIAQLKPVDPEAQAAARANGGA